MKRIMLTQGLVTLVDDDAYEELNQNHWYAAKSKANYYAQRESRLSKDKRITIRMHHCVLGYPPKGMMIDHINGNGLDNQLLNLRFVTARQNNQNRLTMSKESKYPGVGRPESHLRWRARIRRDGKMRLLGRFETEELAFAAYKKAVEALGETVIDL